MTHFQHPRDIKVGVVGYGGAFGMGPQHLHEMHQAGMTPFAVCEIDPQRLEVAQNDFPGIETYGSLDVMLRKSDVDLLVHITPHNQHYPLAAKCIRAGKHVVTEKPFVLTTAQADRLIKLADQHGVMASTYHNRHWDGSILRARQHIVERQRLGDVFRIEAHMGSYGLPRDWWRSSKSVSGGILYDWGVHLIEYALQIVDAPAVEVSGFAKTGYWESKAPKKFSRRGDMNEDEATAVVRFANGCVLNLSISNLHSDPIPPYMIAFVGTKGSYEITNLQTWRTRIASAKGTLVEKTGRHPKDQGHRFYRNIADHLTGAADLVITPQYARRPIHLLDLAGRSAACGRALRVKYG